MTTHDLIKNIEKSHVHAMSELVEYSPNKVVSRTLAQNSSLSLTVFAFAAGEGLSTHSAPGDAMVQVLEGQARITIDGKAFVLDAGQTIVMPADIPHAVDADQPFKMLLIVVKK
jgi:quercetin dioxygenase-like cupin family protein